MTHPEFNPMLSDAFRDNPYPILAHQRENQPVTHLRPGLIDSWSIFRYDDARGVLLDAERFSSDRSLIGDGEFADANLGLVFNNMISAAGERHRRLRMIGNRVFMPKFIEKFRPQVQAVVDERMDMALQGGQFDLVEDFSAQITVSMICAILGLPISDMQQIRKWTTVLGENSGASTWLPELDPALVEQGRETGLEMTRYFTDYLNDRRKTPRDGDLISAFMEVEVEGERLTDDEILSMAMLLLLAGNETTTNLITNFVRLLDAHPEQAARLRADTSMVPSAVEETVRMRNSIRNIDRIATCDVEMHGVQIPKGGLVVVWLSAANRDPSVFPDPDKFIPDRSPNRHVGFGQGIHMCLGAPLARMETQLAAKAILERTASTSLEGAPVLGRNANFDIVTHQSVRFSPN